MTIFNSYVKLPEGSRAAEDHLACFVGAKRGVAVPNWEEDFSVWWNMALENSHVQSYKMFGCHLVLGMIIYI